LRKFFSMFFSVWIPSWLILLSKRFRKLFILWICSNVAASFSSSFHHACIDAKLASYDHFLFWSILKNFFTVNTNFLKRRMVSQSRFYS
jgi:hypothetical protein